MNYLQLVQALHREAGLAGSPPAGVTGLSGMPAKLAAWVQAAWLEIQSARKWSFLLQESTVSLVVGQQEYDVVADWALTHVREFDQSWALMRLPDDSPAGPLRWWSHFRFRECYGAGVGSGMPGVAALVAGSKVRFNALPDQAYKARLAYYMTAEQLAANTDTTSLNEEEQWVIVWKALMQYAAHEGAADVFGTAQAKYQAAFGLLCQRYLPAMSFGAPLV